MPAKPLTPEQQAEAGELKRLFKRWQGERRAQGLEWSQEWCAEQLDFGQSARNQYVNGKIPLNPDAAIKIGRLIGHDVADFSPSVDAEIKRLANASPAPLAAAPPRSAAPSPREEDGSVVLAQFDVSGGMDTRGKLILESEPPGIIQSWKVDREWLRLNVPVYTSVQNLCIVTGFGPSMKGMFNPGDPLLMDRGVNRVDHEGVFFFRVGDEGYIKILQRVPDFEGPGFRLRVISKNPDYPPYELSPKNPHLHIIGKILTVWKSDQY